MSLAKTEPRFSLQEAVEKIHSLRRLGQKNGLENMRRLLSLVGSPAFPCVHIAGTNGKGSVCALTERTLRLAGYRTGLYTSPFIERYEERIRICGVPVSEEILSEAMAAVWPQVEALREEGIYITEFEAGTALAFWIFAREKVDIAVIEVGLGGRLDPTNVVSPLLCGITRIGMDHMELLGQTLTEIAGEKAGILKPGIPAVTGAQAMEAMQVLSDRAAELNCPLDVSLPDSIREERTRTVFSWRGLHFFLENLELSLPGAHQAENGAVALALLERLCDRYPVTEDIIRQAFSTVHWPGRLEWFESVLLDGAHNDPGVESLCQYASAHLTPEHTVLVCGMMRDKDTGRMARMLSRTAGRVICTCPRNPRAMPAQELAEKFPHGQAAVVEDPEKALEKAMHWAGPEDTVLVCGSLYLIGDVRPLLHGEERADV